MHRGQLEAVVKRALVDDWEPSQDDLVGWTGNGLDGDVRAVVDALIKYGWTWQMDDPVTNPSMTSIGGV